MTRPPKILSTRAVISLGVDSPPPSNHPWLRRTFSVGLARIESALRRDRFSGGYIYWDRGYPAGCPPHSQSPFAFKPFCFQEARRLGYEQVLWLDAAVEIKQPLEPLFAIIERNGYLMFTESHSVGEYCKDEALAGLGITREESFAMPSCWACVVGLNLADARAAEFLRRWQGLAVDGVTFPGAKFSGHKGWPRTASEDPRVKGHRHDQIAASVVALGLDMRDWRSKDFFAAFFHKDGRSIPSRRSGRRLGGLSRWWEAARLSLARRIRRNRGAHVHVRMSG